MITYNFLGEYLMKVGYTIKDEEKKIVLNPCEDGWEVEWVNPTTIQPMFNYIIVQKDEEKSKSNGGIIIPDSSKEKPSTGTVMAVGNGVWDDKSNSFRPMTVKVGDRVLFPKLTGQTIKVNDEEVFLIKEENLLAIVK